MLIGVNLASRPYHDEARFYRQWGTALGLVVLATAFIVAISFRQHGNSRKEWANARSAETQLASLKKEEAQAQQILSAPENRGTRDRSQFLNAAILRKSFSWTRLMEDMEKVMPAGLRVVSIAPVTDRSSRFVLKVQVQGERRESAIELVRNMERSPHFRAPQLSLETHTANTAVLERGVKSEITTSYLPAATLEVAE